MSIEYTPGELFMFKLGADRERRRIRRALKEVLEELEWQSGRVPQGSPIADYWIRLHGMLDASTRAPRQRKAK